MKRLLLALAAVSVGALGVTVASQRSAAAMSSAAEQWLASLTPDQKQRATFPFDSDERQHWHYVPNEQFPRKGVQIKEMTDA
jgi:Ni/Co efflux regulator RcnB